MKKLFALLALVGVSALVGYLWFSKNLAENKARELERSWTASETRLLQVEADLLAAKQQLAELSNVAAKAQSPLANGQNSLGSVTYSATSGSLVRIEGTSTVHDWQSEGSLIGGTLILGQPFSLSNPLQPNASIQASATVFIPARSIKSVEPNGKPYSDKMDEIMYEKLKAATINRILFSLTQLTTSGLASGTNAANYLAAGDLAVAGVTNHITMPVQIAATTTDRLQITGSVKVKMTDFGIQPPEPIGTMIKTGDEVTLKFLWLLQPTANVASRK